jgi:glyoxylase-like metal-dependent hydrolase (beta-lactamase superfamily II)
MKIESFNFNDFRENTYIISNNEKKCIIIDPGCYSYEERQSIYSYLEDNQLEPTAIVNTHAHIDHVLGVAPIMHKYKIPFYLHPLEKPVLENVAQRAEFYGFPNYQVPEKVEWTNQEGPIEIGGFNFEIFFVPGHAPGHISLYFKEEKCLFAGDLLFRRSVGRTDLPLCSTEDLINSLQNKIYLLPEDTIVYPGHGGITTIGEEKQENPYVKAK